MSGNVAELKQRILELQDEVEYYKSCYTAFFTGNVPMNATLEHSIMAQYGRIRLEKRKQTPALLASR